MVVFLFIFYFLIGLDWVEQSGPRLYREFNVCCVLVGLMWFFILLIAIRMPDAWVNACVELCVALYISLRMRRYVFRFSIL